MPHISDDNELYFWYIYLLFIGSKITPSSSTLTKIFTSYWLINNLDDIVHKEKSDFNENTYNITIKHK
jgi:hypothetical protein